MKTKVCSLIISLIISLVSCTNETPFISQPTTLKMSSEVITLEETVFGTLEFQNHEKELIKNYINFTNGGCLIINGKEYKDGDIYESVSSFSFTYKPENSGTNKLSIYSSASNFDVLKEAIIITTNGEIIENYYTITQTNDILCIDTKNPVITETIFNIDYLYSSNNVLRKGRVSAIINKGSNRVSKILNENENQEFIFEEIRSVSISSSPIESFIELK